MQESESLKSNTAHSRNEAVPPREKVDGSTRFFIVPSDALVSLVSLQVFYLWVGKCVSEMFIRDVLGCPNYASIPPNMVGT